MILSLPPTREIPLFIAVELVEAAGKTMIADLHFVPCRSAWTFGGSDTQQSYGSASGLFFQIGTTIAFGAYREHFFLFDQFVKVDSGTMQYDIGIL